MGRPKRHPRAAPPHWPHEYGYPVEVAGMPYHDKHIDSLLAKSPYRDTILYCCATLLPNPKNMHDANAVEVRIDGWHVGHLYREQAACLHAALNSANTSEGPTTCDAIIVKRFDEWYERDETYGRLALNLNHPAADRSPPRPRHKEPMFTPMYWGELFVSNGTAVILANAVRQELASKCFVGMDVEVFVSEESGNVHFNVPGGIGGSGRITVIHLDDLRAHNISANDITATVMGAGERFISIWFPIRDGN